MKESEPLLDLLNLCRDDIIINSPTNLTLIVHIIENICRNPKMFTNLSEQEKQGGADEGAEEEKKDPKEQQQPKKKEEEVLVCKYKLDKPAVEALCSLLYSEHLNNVMIEKLSFIIGVFS
jgi:hypothetical protein